MSVIDEKLRDKLVTEFQHMRNHATGPLAQFLDYITYGYMIDNIVLLITGTLHQRYCLLPSYRYPDLTSRPPVWRLQTTCPPDLLTS